VFAALGLAHVRHAARRRRPWAGVRGLRDLVAALCGGVGLPRGRFDAGGMRWVNRISGGLIVAFGALALASLLPWELS
jgi:hypothetical protein